MEAVHLFVAMSSMIGLVELLRFLQRRYPPLTGRWWQAVLFGGSIAVLAYALTLIPHTVDAGVLAVCIALLAMLSGLEGAFVGGSLLAMALPQFAITTLLTVFASGIFLQIRKSPVFAVTAAWLGLGITALLQGASVAGLTSGAGDILSTVVGAGAFWIYVSEVDHRRAELLHAEEQATTDPLTGLVNRAGLAQDLARQHSGALIAIDLDDFKSVNEIYGHTAGDLLLREVARRLRLALRPQDSLARIGGDEFVAAIAGADVDIATAVASRMDDALAQEAVALPDGDLPIRASFGIAAGNLQDLFPRADAALLQAKADGKARVRVHGEQRSRDPQEEQLLRVTSSVRSLLEDLDEGVVIVGPNRRIVWSSPNYAALAGISRQDAAGRKPHDVYGSEITDRMLLREIPRALERDGIWRGELVNRRPDGELWWADWSMCRIAVRGRALGFLGMVRDATPAHRSSAEVLTSAISMVAQRQDPWIRDHVERTGRYMKLLVEAFQARNGRGLLPLNPEEYRLAATLHDVGKMFVPASILLKRGPLSKSERTVIRRHPQEGYEYLRECCERWCDAPSSDYFRMLMQGAMEIALHHHEHWQGDGYPSGLSGRDIPMAARLFSAIDVYDALCSSRPHKDAWPEDEAFAYLEERAGTEFDPAAVELISRWRQDAVWQAVAASRTA